MGFVAEGVKAGRRPELVGGGLIRSRVGGGEYQAGRRSGQEIRGDERILGNSTYVEWALREAEVRERRRKHISRMLTPAQVISCAASAMGISDQDVHGGSKQPTRALARSLACKWLVEDLGMAGVAVSELLGITPSSVSKNVVRGRQVESERRLNLERVS